MSSSSSIAVHLRPRRRAGDWDCPRCRVMIFGSKSECSKCHAQRPTQTQAQTQQPVSGQNRSPSPPPPAATVAATVAEANEEAKLSDNGAAGGGDIGQVSAATRTERKTPREGDLLAHSGDWAGARRYWVELSIVRVLLAADRRGRGSRQGSGGFRNRGAAEEQSRDGGDLLHDDDGVVEVEAPRAYLSKFREFRGSFRLVATYELKSTSVVEAVEDGQWIRPHAFVVRLQEDAAVNGKTIYFAAEDHMGEKGRRQWVQDIRRAVEAVSSTGGLTKSARKR